MTDEELRKRLEITAAEFAETQAMFKFSHAELDRRVTLLEVKNVVLEESHRALEETVSELQARVERLESSSPPER